MEAAIPTGSGACHPMFGPDKKHIYVCNQFDNSVVEIDPVMRKVVRSVKVLREPKSAVFSKDGKYMFVTNFLPAQRADVDVVAACVSVIEMEGFTKVKDIQLRMVAMPYGGCVSRRTGNIYTCLITWDDSRCLLPNFNKVG